MKRYIRSYTEADGYWYLSRHGVGPGCWPKDAKMMEYKEHPTNAYKCYVKLDRMLTTQELKDYDLKEEMPSDVEGSSERVPKVKGCPVKGSISPADDDYTERITTALTRWIEIVIENVEVEVDENSIEFSKYDWVESLGDEFGYIPSVEDDPEIDDLDDVDGVIEKVQKLLLDKVFDHVDRYRTFTINKCSVDLAYIVEDVEYEANNRGYYTHQGDVDYSTDNIHWSEADSTIDCDYSRL